MQPRALHSAARVSTNWAHGPRQQASWRIWSVARSRSIYRPRAPPSCPCTYEALWVGCRPMTATALTSSCLEFLVPGRNCKPHGMFFLQSHTSRARGHAMAKNTICLWYDKDAEAAARFYAEAFPDSAVGAIHRAPSDYPSGKQGDV